MPSFISRNESRSDRGSPTRARKTDDGSGMAKSVANSHCPLSMKPSMSSLTNRVISGSSRFIRRGAKIGSRSRRYFRWSGGSTCNGIRGTDWPRSTASMPEENSSGWVRAYSTAPRRTTWGPYDPATTAPAARAWR